MKHEDSVVLGVLGEETLKHTAEHQTNEHGGIVTPFLKSQVHGVCEHDGSNNESKRESLKQADGADSNDGETDNRWTDEVWLEYLRSIPADSGGVPVMPGTGSEGLMALERRRAMSELRRCSPLRP